MVQKWGRDERLELAAPYRCEALHSLKAFSAKPRGADL